jgi:uncharacterized membrane protein
MNKEDRRLLLFLLLSHHRPDQLHRTIRLPLGGRNIYLCARCTGEYSAILILFIAWFLGFEFPEWLYLPLISILPLPSAVDWVTQSCKLRESRNMIRVFTGFLLGITKGLFLLMLVKGLFYMLLPATVICGGYILSICLIAWKTKFFDSYFD